MYYYRGAVTNNYVQFAGFCWKIVRTNEDGSVKLMYWGPKNGTTCSTTATTPSSLTGKAFNSTTSDNRYVGYMYGTSCSDYTSCHTNTTNSTIKGLIDDWYDTNINSQGTTITFKIADTIYCNDRMIGAAGNINGRTYGSLGYGTDNTLYGPARRLAFYSTNVSPQYNCPNKDRDGFTLKVSKGGTAEYGNNALDYPVGLLTADETSYAGGVYNTSNTTYFLNTGVDYWTMSPFFFVADTYEWYMESNGNIKCYYDSSFTIGAFPVISLNSNALVSSGEGTVSEPYIIQE